MNAKSASLFDAVPTVPTGEPWTDFAAVLVKWQRVHGRHELPWQRDRDPYRIWVSEIMLQQTQVTAVIPYFERFMARYPDVGALGRAPVDDVMQAWSGLGYYARARNLHRAARVIVEDFAGEFPRTPQALAALPGIGRSTAAAVAVFSFGVRAAILDGNVKRVLSRAFAVHGWPGEKGVENTLWDLAESVLPERDVEAYTQGLMDLGSLVCTRGRPNCVACPLAAGCRGLRAGVVEQLPTPRPKTDRPHRRKAFLLAMRAGQILLEKRPPQGIWGGLWSLPEGDDREGLERAGREKYGLAMGLLQPLAELEHGFTHYTLTMQPWVTEVTCSTLFPADADAIWIPLRDAMDAGVPAPVRRILAALAASAPLE